MGMAENKKSKIDVTNNDTENQESNAKSTGGNAFLRLPYGIAKDRGLPTEGLTPREVWELLKGKGVKKEEEEKKFIDSQKVGMKEAPQDEPEQFFEDSPKEPTAEELAKKEKQEKIERFLRYNDIWLTQQNGKDALLGRIKNQQDLNFAKENKDAIIAHFKEKERVAQERKEKIRNIEGLAELEKAANEWSDYNYKFRKMQDTEDGYSGALSIKKPSVSTKELAEKYPRAAAYREAENYENASNYAKAAAGSRAKERIINGEDPKKVIKEMEEEWSKAAERAVWNS